MSKIRFFIVTTLLGSALILTTSGSASRPLHDLVLSAGLPFPTATPEKSRCVPCLKADSDKPNLPPNVTDVALDKTGVRVPCSESPTHTELRDMVISIVTTAEDPDDTVLTYAYTVSGGRIVGTGKKVIWDLSRSSPGSYVIVTGVDDGCGVCGTTVTKTVTVRECNAS